MGEMSLVDNGLKEEARKYDQEMPKLQNPDQPTALQHRHPCNSKYCKC